LINLFLIFGAVGSFLVGHSGLMNDSKKGFFVQIYYMRGNKNIFMFDGMDINRAFFLID